MDRLSLNYRAVLVLGRMMLAFAISYFSAAVAYGQQPINGEVRDSLGKPLESVLIRVPGGIKTVSGTDGKFTLILKTGKHRISFSLVGYTSLDTVISYPFPGKFSIVLSAGELQLETVQVSTGYQTLPKERATGSFLQLSGKILGEQVGTDIISRLEGITSSLSIDRKSNGGGGYGIIIRGISTLQGPRSPLIVLDNFPYEGDINNINPNDVESITVLKDAAAASIWGARAGNGVIVISTKKAKFNQALKVSFSGSVKVTVKPDQYYRSRISSSDFVDLENFLFDKGYYSSFETSPSKVPLTEVVELRIAARDGQISSAAASAGINALRDYDFREQLDRYIFKDATAQQYNLQLSAGSAKRNWLLSAGFDRNLSTLSAGLNRYTVKAEQNFRITNKLTLSANLMLSHSVSENGRTDPSQISSATGILPPYTRLADDAGNPLAVMRDYRMAYLQGAGSGKLLDWSYYPLEDYKFTQVKGSVDDVIASLRASYQITGWLKMSASYQFQQQESATNTANGPESYYVRNLVNVFTSVDATGTYKRNIPYGSILDQDYSLLSGHNARAQADVAKDWGRHSLTALFGGEIRSTGTEGNTDRIYGFNGSTYSTAVVDYVNPVKTFVSGSNDYIQSRDGLSSKLNRFVSLFVNMAYTFDGRYTLSLSGRRDASNLYGLKTNDKWNPLFSSGLSWDISKEKFFRPGLLSFLKLRTTFGASGNTDASSTAVTTISYSGFNSVFTQTPYALFSNYANPQLKWERVFMFNGGLDFALKGNRIKGSLEYYIKKSVDLLATAPVDLTAGVGITQVRNSGVIRGNGIDLELSSVNIAGKFSWSTDFFLNYYRDKVIKNYIGTFSGRSKVGAPVSNTGIVDYPLYSMLSFKWAGLDPLTGDPQGMLNGVVSKNYDALIGSSLKFGDMVYHGPALPTITGGLGNSFSYGRWTLSFRLSYKLGYYFRKESLDYGSLFLGRDGHGEYAQRWQRPGDELSTSVPSLIYPNSDQRDEFYWGSEVNVLKGDHLRLQYINLGYTFGLKNGNRTGFNKINVFAVAGNLGIIWRANRQRIDPDYVGIPDPRNIAFGFKTAL